MVDEESKRELERHIGKVGKSLNESKREEESRNERAREWGGLKANHVASRTGVSYQRAEQGWRIATVSRIRMLRTSYNGHSSELKPSVQRCSTTVAEGSTVFAVNANLTSTLRLR